MNRDKWDEVKAVFNSAVELSPGERDDYLEDACGSDQELRQVVEELLRSYRTSFLDNGSPPHGAAARARYSLQPGSSLRHYEILNPLGEGGMGQVYLAYDQRLARKVALKIFSMDVAGNRDQLDRFIREARAASDLHHPNICTVYEIDPEHEPPFISMEYVEGRTLADMITLEKIGAEQATDILIQVAQGLAEAHDAGIVHRDIKPANIVITKSGAAKLVDFGIAKKIFASADDLTQRQLSSAGMIIGTISYMSPEQARGKEVDARSDIWSLGVIFYELLTGELPFRGDTPGDIISEIIKSNPFSVGQFDSPVAAEINHLLTKALAKDRDLRYASARHLIEDLKTIKSRIGDFTEDRTARLISSENGNGTLTLRNRTSDAAPPATRNISQQLQSKSFYILIGLLTVTMAAFGLTYFTKQTPVIESLAVMPFLNETGDPNSEYLSDGITESLIGRLSQIPDLSVKARSSVFRFKGTDVAIKDIGKELSVPGILTGRLRRRGSEYNLYIELVDSANEKVIWQAEYVRPESSLATIPSEIARDVASKLRQKLSSTEEQSITRNYTDNSAAYELYLKGRFYWDKRNEEAYKVAIDSYNQAIALDPNYALAYAGLADCYLFRTEVMSRREALPMAKRYALKALELDKSLAEAYTTLALVNENYEFDMAEAEANFKRAIELKPNYAIAHQWYSGLLTITGRPEEGLAEAKRATELEPYSAAINWGYGTLLLLAKRYDEAIAQEEKTLRIQPGYPLAEFALADAYSQTKRFDEALAILEKHARNAARSEEALARIASIYAVMGRRSEAFKVLDGLLDRSDKSDNFGYRIAWVYTALGQNDDAIRWLNRGYEDRAFQMMFLGVDPWFSALHADPGFQELLHRTGLG